MSQYQLNDNFPSNSHKSNVETPKQENKKPDIPVFEGEVAGVRRKPNKSFVHWLRKMFLSDRKPTDIFMDIIENQVVPGIKDGFRNSLVSSVDMFIYKNGQTSNTTATNNISYGKMYRGNGSTANNTNNQASNTVEKKDSEFTNPCFRSQTDAVKFLSEMRAYDYPTLSVHTLYMMRRQRIDYTWDAWGWTHEEIMQVKIVHINNPDYPWMIDLPPAHIIA